MRIAIDCRLFGSSGIGTFIENVVYYITQDADNTFLLIGSPQNLRDYANKENCTIISCEHAPFSLKELFLFPQKVVNQCDAFFSPNFNLPLGIKIPIFSMVHDIVFLDIKDINSPLGRAIRSLFIRRALKISKTVFTVSKFTRQRLIDYFGTRTPIQVVSNGISRQLLQYSPQQDANREESYIIFLGNLKIHKGIQTLVEAYKKGKAEGIINDKLYIVGRFNFRVKDKFIEELSKNPDPDIRFITDADNTEVYRLISGARLLVSPSLYEGFGLTPLEALYLGTPVVISDIPAHKEIYQGSPAVFFHAGDTNELKEKITALYQRVDARRWIADHYTYKHTATKLLEIIQATAGKLPYNDSASSRE